MLLNGSALNSTAINGSSVSIPVLFPKKRIIGRKYICTIVATGFDSIIIPISSISARLKLSQKSDMDLVCPNGNDYGGFIIDRKDGYFTIKTYETYSDGTIEELESQQFNNLQITYQQGGRNYSVGIRGECSLLTNNPKRKINLQGISYIALQSNGFRTIRCNLDKDFLPGDTAILSDEDEVTINSVTHVINSNFSNMELTEG